jgi:hypothetical protein
MIVHGLGERAEDNAEFAELLLERRRDRHAVEHGVDGDPGEPLALAQRNAEFFVGL